MNSSAKYQFALSRKTNSMIHISNVESGLKCNSYCYECGEDLIAINKERNKQIVHFRHNDNSNCSGNYESYIHWVTKEAFRDLKSIELPEININNLSSDYQKQLKSKLIDIDKKFKVPKKLRITHLQYRILQEKTILEFDNPTIEETIKTDKGNIRVDIVILKGKDKLFIEPFFTHKIDSEKLEKIIKLNISTLEIDLNPLVNINEFSFTEEKLKKYLKTDPLSKSWIHLKISKINRLIENICKEYEERVKAKGSQFERYKEIESKIKEIEKEKEKLDEKLKTTTNDLKDKWSIEHQKILLEKEKLVDIETEFHHQVI